MRLISASHHLFFVVPTAFIASRMRSKLRQAGRSFHWPKRDRTRTVASSSCFPSIESQRCRMRGFWPLPRPPQSTSIHSLSALAPIRPRSAPDLILNTLNLSTYAFAATKWPQWICQVEAQSQRSAMGVGGQDDDVVVPDAHWACGVVLSLGSIWKVETSRLHSQPCANLARPDNWLACAPLG